MKKIICAFCVCLVLSACGIGNTNTTYSRSDIGQQALVDFGRIIAIRPVNVEGTSTVGTLGGAIAGGAAGSMIGGNTAVNIIGGVGGAIVGGVAGSAAEKAITADTAMQFIVQKQNGQTISVIQSNEEGLKVGDPVLISNTKGTLRLQYFQ